MAGGAAVVRIGVCRPHLPDRVDARVPVDLRCLDRRIRGGAGHLRGRTRPRRAHPRAEGRPPSAARPLLRAARSHRRRVRGAHALGPDDRSIHLLLARRYVAVGNDRRHVAPARPQHGRARRADDRDGGHASGSRPRRDARERHAASARGGPLRPQHARRRRRVCRVDVLSARDIRYAQHAVARCRAQHADRRCGPSGRSVLRDGRRRRGICADGRGRRTTGAGCVPADCLGCRGFRVLPDGTRLVSNARSAPRRLRFHLRVDPRGRAGGHRRRRAPVFDHRRQSSGVSGRAGHILSSGSGGDCARVRARRSNRRPGPGADAARSGRVRRARGWLDHRRRSGRPSRRGDFRLSVPSVDRIVRPGTRQCRPSNRPGVCGQHAWGDRRVTGRRISRPAAPVDAGCMAVCGALPRRPRCRGGGVVPRTGGPPNSGHYA